MAGYPKLNANTASEFIGEASPALSLNSGTPTRASISIDTTEVSATSSIFNPENEDDIEDFSEEEIIEEVIPVEEIPVEEAPVEDAPVEDAPVEEAPVEEAPVEEAPEEQVSPSEIIVDQKDAVIQAPKKVSIKDLPTLASNVDIPVFSTGWGSNVKPKQIDTKAMKSLSGSFPSAAAVEAKPMRSKHIQESFKINGDTSSKSNKVNYTEIASSVKKQFKVSIESTTSATGRLIIVSGNSDDVINAKRILLKRLEKPVNVELQVPTSCKPAIIGLGGRNIRELISKYQIRIHIEDKPIQDSFDENLNDTLTNIELYGDSASVDLVKKNINTTVKEETKNATFRVPVENKSLIAYINIKDVNDAKTHSSIKVQFNEKNEEFTISGSREEAKEVMNEVKSYLSNLSASIEEENIKIPYKFQVLIDAYEIRKTFNVTVEFPKTQEEETVRFVGPKDKVSEAINFARTTSKDYLIEVLDISRSHSNNLEHAKRLVLLFEKYNSLKKIAAEYEGVKFYLPSFQKFENSKSVEIIITSLKDSSKLLKFARKEIINLVDGISPADLLIIDDIEYELFHRETSTILEANTDIVKFIQLGDVATGNNEIVLAAYNESNDFKPAADEIKSILEKSNKSLDKIRESQHSLASETLMMESNLQDELLNSNSKPYLLIDEEIEKHNGSIQIKLHTPDSDSVLIRGHEKSIKLAKKSLSMIIENPERKHNEVIDVPADVLSRFIGVKGANIQAIRSKYDITTQFADADTKPQSKEPMKVTLIGIQYNVKRAVEFINTEIKRWSDIITKEFIAPLQYHAALIGRRGANLNHLQNKYSVNINFPRENTVVTIRGPSRLVNQAYDELHDLLEFEMKNSNKVVVKVPVAQISRVIGKSGQMINDLRAAYGVEMDFIEETNDLASLKTDQVQLEIVGTKEAIKEASEKVTSILFNSTNFTTENIEVDQKYYKNIIGQNGATLRDIIFKSGGDHLSMTRPINIPRTGAKETHITVQGPKEFVKRAITHIKEIVANAENSITKELDIESGSQGALIGPAGTVRRQLESEFKITLQIPNRGDTKSKVKLIGLPENIEKAEKKIFTEIIKKNFDLEVNVPASIHEFVSERGAFAQSLRINQFVSVRYGSYTKLANTLNNRALSIPIDDVSGNDDEKLKLTITSAPISADSQRTEIIPWRIRYEPVELEGLLSDDSEFSSDEEKKNHMLNLAKQLIEKRISLAPTANTVGYIWAKDTSKFNSVVGPAGTRIIKLRDITGCIINIPRNSEKIKNVIYVRGTESDVKACTQTIMDLLK
ncbi:hypothetical protein TPHA_0I02770 [Tetrapisispora phaffii CBS 4417]|uniref:K Homology domain-containing protein n=1 Tax=Tetrapisispora phaffii (strain ATCC 24235 / CBS 4417 / NBRC 1672 / NRRL Y-8282 / UCD 70-5) TaxID=1071381 RepID=G8BY00_TETPH|nr:hypothetical protein TPHA_0I02770 [Tetrapisispora phaffii CBS 4417]CCE64778.1 hypothetical protein TPHA_0I02770 [Tetrapisispora phaffii CBS 4417]